VSRPASARTIQAATAPRPASAHTIQAATAPNGGLLHIAPCPNCPFIDNESAIVARIPAANQQAYREMARKLKVEESKNPNFCLKGLYSNAGTEDMDHRFFALSSRQ
jgi:hypothetical protein